MFNGESKSISTLTMWRELKGLGLNSYVALRKPLISEAQRKKRLQFAREHKDWTLEQWKKVMWCGESRRRSQAMHNLTGWTHWMRVPCCSVALHLTSMSTSYGSHTCLLYLDIQSLNKENHIIILIRAAKAQELTLSFTQLSIFAQSRSNPHMSHGKDDKSHLFISSTPIYFFTCCLPYLGPYSACDWFIQILTHSNHQSSCLNQTSPTKGNKYQPIGGRIGLVRMSLEEEKTDFSKQTAKHSKILWSQ